MAQPVDVLVIVGAEGEDDAAKLVDEGASGDWSEIKGPEDYGFPIWTRRYKAEDGRAMRFALTRAFKQGMSGAGYSAARLVDHFKPSCLAMCGVCAGRPERTNLGDVIIGTQLWQYDFGKLKGRKVDAGVDLRPQGARYPFLPQWKQAAERFVLPMQEQLVALRPRTLNDQKLWLLNELRSGRDPLKSAERETMCANWPAVIADLLEHKWVKRKGETASLLAAGREHVKDVIFRNAGQLPTQPEWKIHAKPIGTGSSNVELDEIWELLEKQDREVHGLEMEAAVIGETAHVQGVPHMIVVKGVMDYAVPGKNDGFREFAARASAEVLFAFLRAKLKLDTSRRCVRLSPNTAQLPDDPSPATLLNARYEAVDFDRAACGELWGDLQSWCASDDPVSVRLFVGPGGSGKTRMFIQLAKELCERDWQAGFWPDGASPDDLDTLLATQQATLVVLDYAEARPDLLQLLKRAAEPRRGGGEPKLRVVLLAREVADWWKSVKEQDESVNDLLMRQEVVAVAPVPLEGAARQRQFENARDQFALRRAVPPPTRTVNLTDDRFGRLLYLQLAALGVVDGFEELGADKLLDGAVTHEKHFWQRRFSEEHGTMDDALVFLEKAARTVAAVTLRGRAATFDDAQRINEWADGPETGNDVFLRFLHRLYPGKPVDDGAPFYLTGLEPDLLGEQLIARVLTDPHTSSAYLANILQDDHPAALFQTFVVLGRLSLRAGWVIAWMEKALNGDINARAKPAFLAAMSLGDQSAFGELGRMLAKRLSEQGSVEVAEFIDRAAPEQTVSLMELCVWATQRLLDAPTADSSDENILRERARLFNNLGNRLGQIGKREEALDATREAVKHFRKLAGARPDEFLAALAASFGNLGNRLSQIGKREEALDATREAVKHLRKLAETRPDAFLPDLAMSLTNLGTMLNAIGKPEEALHAAREGVKHYRKLAEARPGAFLPDLAMSLNNLGNRLSQIGKREEALDTVREAVKHYRKLAEERPDAFLPDLAMSLNNLGNRLSEFRKREEALDATREAVDIRRKLAEARPDAFLPALALSLNNLGTVLSAIGKREEALDAAREAVNIRRKLAEARPDAFLPNLAASLNNFGNRLSELGKRAEALDATREAVKHYRKLAEARPDAFLPDVAMSLNNLGADLSEMGKPEEALDATREGFQCFLTITPSAPARFVPDLVESLQHLEKQLEETGVDPQSDALVQKGHEMLQRYSPPEEQQAGT